MGWLILILVVIGIYVALVVLFFVYVGPILFAGIAMVFAVWFLSEYVRTLHAAMAVDPPSNPAPLASPPPVSPEEWEQPAFREYFFGQAVADLKHVVLSAFIECKGITTRSAEWIQENLFRNEDLIWATWPAGVVAYVGLASGVIGGAIAFAAFAWVHIVVVLSAQVLGMGVAYLLRTIDAGILAVRRIRITCPHCYEEVEFPEYDCPSNSCSQRHTDLRSGEYGILRRSCICLTQMPTLIFLGSHRLDAFCPYCKHPLADGTGTAPEVILPVMGGTAAGKTRLMASMIMALDQMIHQHGATLVFADKHTKLEFDRHRQLLVADQNTRATQVGSLPRAYSVYVAPSSGARKLVHMFDPAGEVHNTTERMQELQYISVARSFLFVIDPLSIDPYWDQLSEDERTELLPNRPDPRLLRPPELVYQTSYDNILRMDVDTKSSRLAVSLSKSDILAATSVQANAGLTSREIEAWLLDELGLGNMVRSMRLSFREVAFFFTAAVARDEGVDGSVVELLRWLFAGEQIELSAQNQASIGDGAS